MRKKSNPISSALVFGGFALVGVGAYMLLKKKPATTTLIKKPQVITSPAQRAGVQAGDIISQEVLRNAPVIEKGISSLFTSWWNSSSDDTSAPSVSETAYGPQEEPQSYSEDHEIQDFSVFAGFSGFKQNEYGSFTGY